MSNEFSKIKQFLNDEPQMSENEYAKKLSKLATELGISKSNLEKLFDCVDVSEELTLRWLKGFQGKR